MNRRVYISVDVPVGDQMDQMISIRRVVTGDFEDPWFADWFETEVQNAFLTIKAEIARLPQPEADA